MSSREQIRECVLQEGLEDLIPLPEIVQTIQSLGLASDEHVVGEVAAALLSLLRDGKVQIWSGHWSEEARFEPTAGAGELLMDPEQYEFNSPADLKRRVYFVNVDNLRMCEEP